MAASRPSARAGRPPRRPRPGRAATASGRRRRAAAPVPAREAQLQQRVPGPAGELHAPALERRRQLAVDEVPGDEHVDERRDDRVAGLDGLTGDEPRVGPRTPDRDAVAELAGHERGARRHDVAHDRDACRYRPHEPLPSRRAPEHGLGPVDHRAAQAREPADHEGVHLGRGVVALPRLRSCERGRRHGEAPVEHAPDGVGREHGPGPQHHIARDAPPRVDGVSPAAGARELGGRDEMHRACARPAPRRSARPRRRRGRATPPGR